MQILKNKAFQRWAKELELSDSLLLASVEEMKKGLYEANLGGSVYKKRVAVGNRRKRGSVRTIIAFKIQEKAFFIYGFSKNKKANITHKEEEALKTLAKIYFNHTENEIEQAIKKGEFFEVKS